LVFHAYINEMHGSRSKIPSKKSRPYIYDVKFLALLGAPYVYDIRRLRVNFHHSVPRMFAYAVTAWWLFYVPPGLTLTNSTFRPHSVFMCFVWISEQTAIISL
jgi:hypothetical protein